VSLADINPEVAQIIGAAELVAKEIEQLTTVSKQINDRLDFLTQYTVGIHEICHNLAIAAKLVATPVIETESICLGIEEEQRLVWDLLKKLISTPGGDKKASEIVKTHCPKMEGKALDKIRAMTDENALFEMRKAINQAMPVKG